MELESLESLWFYGNVLSSKASVLSDSFRSLTLTKHVEEEQEEEHEAGEEEVLHIVEAEKKTEEEFKAEVLGDVVDESDVADTLDFPSLSTIREEERRRRRRLRARSKKGIHRNMRRKILGELDLKEEEGFGENGDWFFVDEGLGFKGHQRLNLDDNMAMKEHLKTWAHAVACAVR